MDMRGSTEKHHIQWSAFESNIARTFGDLKEDKAFADVTIVCGNQRLEANKIVLSVGSTFFRRIFNENPHPHPLICMVGIKFSDLEALLNFAYFGEAFVVEDEEEGFPFQLLEEEEPSSEEGGVISFNDIETECPADTVCVERFFCAEFSGNTASDQIVKHFYVHQILNIFNWI